MKDPKVVSFSPMFHLTEQQDPRPRLLLRARPHDGPPHGARGRPGRAAHERARSCSSSLAGIEETVLLYQGERGRPRARRMLTEMDPTQRRLYDLFGLEAYAPRR